MTSIFTPDQMREQESAGALDELAETAGVGHILDAYRLRGEMIRNGTETLIALTGHVARLENALRKVALARHNPDAAAAVRQCVATADDALRQSARSEAA